MKLTFNVLLSLIIQSKIQGKGKIGNGRLLVEFLQTFADFDKSEKTHEWCILKMFNEEQVKSCAYVKINAKIDKFLSNGKRYPYTNIRFEEFEKTFLNEKKYCDHLTKMKNACGKILDKTKTESLVYTLLEILRQDNSISVILYGNRFIAKEELFGSCGHPKQICTEALLLGLFYHTHKYPAESETVELLNVPENTEFRLVSFIDKQSLELDIPINFIENILNNARRQKAAEMKYQLEIRHGDKAISELPEKDNIFLYGIGGVGKSTLLMDRINNDDSVNFYFPLYKYSQEIHEKFQEESCQILLQILLKYHYRNEYRIYDACIACEGENIILRQLTELCKLFKNKPMNCGPQYTLLLDGFNEIPHELQDQFANELEQICREWKNVRIIITGRTVPQYSVIRSFRHIEIMGVTDSERDSALSVLSNYEDIIQNDRLMEILKAPLFLNIFIENQCLNKSINTRGELLDAYAKNKFLHENDVVRFIILYALPFAAHDITNHHFPTISRGDLLEAIDKAIEFYILNDRVYQNYIAPKRINKKALLESRDSDDFIEIILKNIGFLEKSDYGAHKLRFVHQYFHDYFSAKYVLNIIEAMDIGFGRRHSEEMEYWFHEFRLDSIWYTDLNEEEIYRLIGEISGDYKNIPCEDFYYHHTLLDTLLDLCRGFNCGRAIENVIEIMKVSRNNVICGVDFSRIKLPVVLDSSVKYSLNGKYPCSFEYCKVYVISDFQFSPGDFYYLAYSDDNSMLIFLDKSSNVILLDVNSRKVIGDYDFYTYLSCKILDYAEFLPDNKTAIVLSNDSLVKFDEKTGNVIECITDSDKVYDYKRKTEENKDLDDAFLLEITTQLDRFKNCDFRGAEFKFFESEYKEYLRKMGAIVD